MRSYLSRADYNRLFLEPMTVGDPDPAKAMKAVLAREYPRTTGQVVTELRTRGIDADVQGLHYLIRAEHIPTPRRDGSEFLWTPGHIDAAAAWMDERSKLTPAGTRSMLEATDLAQDIEARRAAERAHPLINPDLFVRIVRPGLPGRDIPAKVTYRPMTAEEQAELTAALD